jgi:two-component system, cell cycle sensor histidine kinase and response regulator CckA
LAETGEEAVNLFMARKGEIALVMLDIVMPGMGGREAYGRMKAIRPDLPVIYSTGHTAESASLDTEIAHGATFIQKPYSTHNLASIVRVTLDRKAS